MKKVLALLLAFVMVFSVLAACGPTEEDPVTTDPPGTDTPSEKPSEDPSEDPEDPTDDPTETGWESKDPNYGTIVIGSSTEISGDWGRALWTNNATDATIRQLIDAYNTVMSNKEAQFQINDTIVANYETEELENGNKIFKITVHDDLTYNNGDPITAKDFVAETLFSSSQEQADLGGKGSAHLTIAGGAE